MAARNRSRDHRGQRPGINAMPGDIDTLHEEAAAIPPSATVFTCMSTAMRVRIS